MHAFTHSLLLRGNLIEIDCWNSIAHEACKATPPRQGLTYWYWSNLYWDTHEIARAVRYPESFNLPIEYQGQDLNVPQLIDDLNAVGLQVITFE